MNIALLGASGRTGQEVVKQALQQGHSVIALVRSPEKLGDLQDRIKVVVGSATNTDDVAKAIHDADCVIHTVSVPFFHPKPTQLFSQVATAVIAARPQTKATQYIVMSSFGTGHGRRLPRPANWGYEFFLGDVADDKEKEEALLEASDLPRTIVKAVLLNDAIIGDYTLTPFTDFKPTLFAHVSRATVAKAMLDIAKTREHLREKVVVS